jgi:hypothetical protein
MSMKSLFTYVLLLVAFAGGAQSLVSVSPSTGAAGTSVNVTITGSGTSFTNSSVFVLSSGASVLTVSNVAASSGTSVQAKITIPANAASGGYTLTTLSGFTPVSLANAFTVTGGGGAGASITTVDPDSGYQGQFIAVMVIGSHTSFTQSTTTTGSLVKAPGTPIVSVGSFATNDTTMFTYFQIPTDAALGTYTLALSTTSDGILTKSNAFTVTASPFGSLVSVTPDEGNKGDTMDIVIRGTGNSFTLATTLSVEIYASSSGGPLVVNTTEILTDSTILCSLTIPLNARSGLYDVYVVIDSMTYLPLTEAFTVIGDSTSDAHLVSVTPATAHQGESLSVTVKGSHTNFMGSTGTQMAIFSVDTFIEATSIVSVNDSVLTAHFDIPAGFPVGLYDFGVMADVDGYLELLQSFTITTGNVGISEVVKKGNNLNVYPNPATETLTFQTADQVLNVLMTDITGKQIRIPLNMIKQNQTSYSLDLESNRIGKGLWFISVETDQGVQNRKIMVQ